MASKKFDKNSEEWLLFMDFWKLCQDYAIPEDSDEYWESFQRSSDAFYKKYKTEFAKLLVLAELNNLEGIYKNGIKQTE